MRRWLALGVGVVGVVWTPYLYTVLAPGKPRESQLMAATQIEPLPVAQPEVPGADPQAAEEVQELKPMAAERAQAVQPDLAPAQRADEPPRDDPSRAAPAAAERSRLDAPRGAADSAQAARDSTREADPTRQAAEPARPADPTRAAAETSRPADPTRAAAEPARPADPTRAAAEPADPAHPSLLPRTFDAEPRDAAWAAAQEPRVSQLMAAAGLDSEDLAEVLCRRSVCRVTFKAPRLADGIEAALSARARADFADLLLEAHDPRSERPAVLYLLRADQALELPAPE